MLYITLLASFFLANAAVPPNPYLNITQFTLDQSWGTDAFTEQRLLVQKLLCKSCEQLLGVAKTYVRHNKVESGTQIVGFLSDQQYTSELYVSW
jgi:hypothetical protein